MALLCLSSVVAQLRWFAAAGPVGWGQADGSLHQENNYIKKKMGEARTFFSAPQPVSPSRFNPATHLIPFAGRPDKGQAPSWHMGKMTFSAGLLTHPCSSLLKKSEPPAKSFHLRKVVNLPANPTNEIIKKPAVRANWITSPLNQIGKKPISKPRKFRP